jgi:hypothetical protein
MGFFSSLAGSYKKSKRLFALQEEISPPGRTIDDLISDVRNQLSSGTSRRDRALEEFLDLCEADEGITRVQNEYNLSREDLKKIYIRLNAAGLGQWIKGHYAALSTIAYFEPLLYVVESERRGTKWITIVENLLYYWDGNIPQGGLLQQLG